MSAIGGRLPPAVRSVLVAGLLGTAAGLLMAILSISAAQVPPPGAPVGGYVRTFSPPSDGFEVLLDHGDGQAYAALALDPTLSHPEVFAEGRPQAAYFAQRPLFSALVSIGSSAHDDRLPFGMVAATALSTGALLAAAVALLQARGDDQDPRSVALLLVLPGSILIMTWFGPEQLGLACAFAGLAAWTRRSTPGGAVCAATAFALAGLSRETMLVVPVVVGVHALVRRELGRRELAILAVAPVAFVAWGLVVRARFDAAPSTRGNLVLPFRGLSEALPAWGVVDGLVLASIVVLVVAALVRDRRAVETAIAVAYLCLATLFARAVWARWQDFARVLLPCAAFALIAILPRRARAEQAVAEVAPRTARGAIRGWFAVPVRHP